MPNQPSIRAIRLFGPSIRRQEQLNLLDVLVKNIIIRGKAKPSLYRHDLKVSHRHVLERFVRKNGASESVALVLGGTRSVQAYWVAEFHNTSSRLFSRRVELFVDDQGNLYMGETYHDRFNQRYADMLSMRPRLVTKNFMYAERLVTPALNAIAQSGRAA